MAETRNLVVSLQQLRVQVLVHGAQILGLQRPYVELGLKRLGVALSACELAPSAFELTSLGGKVLAHVVGPLVLFLQPSRLRSVGFRVELTQLLRATQRFSWRWMTIVGVTQSRHYA